MFTHETDQLVTTTLMARTDARTLAEDIHEAEAELASVTDKTEKAQIKDKIKDLKAQLKLKDKLAEKTCKPAMKAVEKELMEK